MKTLFSSFTCLNLTQFFSAINDNIYKLLLVFLLINISGYEKSNTIVSLAGAIFVIPFLLFASLAGTFADRYSKRSIIFYTRFFEIITMGLGVLAFYLASPWGAYAILFLMATQSALFSPAKYGIVPEIVEPQRISKSNGILTATTYLAIIVGTFLASFLAQITHKNYVAAASFCVIVAVLGFLTSLGIKKTRAQARNKKVSIHFIHDILGALKKAKRQRYLMPIILCGAYFLFSGAYTQLNMLPFSVQSLGISEIQGGYLFLMSAIGIGIGSLFAGRLSGKDVELAFVPLAAFGIALSFLFMHFFSHNFYAVAAVLAMLGVCGGFYIVPVDAFIQVASPLRDRGQIIAAANFLNFTGVIIASLLIAFLGNVLAFSAAQGFFTVGILTILVAVVLTLVMADQLLRFFASLFARIFWDLRIKGGELLFPGPVIIVGKRTSWLDTFIMMAILPRLIRYIVPVKKHKIARRSFFYSLIRVIPLDETLFSPDNTETIQEVHKELDFGHSVCVLHPIGQEVREFDAPMIWVNIHHIHPATKASKWQQLRQLSRSPIEIAFSKP